MAVASLRMAREVGLAGAIAMARIGVQTGKAAWTVPEKTMASPTARMARAASRVAVMPGVRIGGTIRVG